MRLWDAIDQHRLSPFAYFGIHDGLDLREVPWRRPTGYDVEGLTNLYTASDAWARQVVLEVHSGVDDVRTMRALGFCVSAAQRPGWPGVQRGGDRCGGGVGRQSRRRASGGAARPGRRSGEGGVLGRPVRRGRRRPRGRHAAVAAPNGQLGLFRQQLGRGLRRAPGKSVCTVLDFVGHHRKEFRFDRRFGALLGGTRKDLRQQVEQGFPFLPAGCHMELDAVAQPGCHRGRSLTAEVGLTCDLIRLNAAMVCTCQDSSSVDQSSSRTNTPSGRRCPTRLVSCEDCSRRALSPIWPGWVRLGPSTSGPTAPVRCVVPTPRHACVSRSR